MAKGAKNSRLVVVEGALREEIAHWRFVDDWPGCCPWRPERHLQLISLATDASSYKWGAVVGLEGSGRQVAMADFWAQGDDRPIHIKEAEALGAAIRSVGNRIRGSRVDAYVDNMAVVHAWGRQGCKDIKLARVIKSIFAVVTELNVDLRVLYIPTKDNPADLPSRELSWAEAMLGEQAWQRVDERFGPHSVDLMATDSNAMRRGGRGLRHFTPHPTPLSAGVNVFSQDLSSEGRPYCYPPFCLVGAVLSYLRESGVSRCTLVVPEVWPRPGWWPSLQRWSVDRMSLGSKGQKGVLLVPTRKGYVPDAFGLKWGLTAYNLKFI